MKRGILSGLFWGSVLSIGTLGVVSLQMPLPEASGPGTPATEPVATSSPSRQPVARLDSPEAETVPRPAESAAPAMRPADSARDVTSTLDVPAGSEFRRALPETEAALPVPDEAPAANLAPSVPVPEAVESGVAVPNASAGVRPATPGMMIVAPNAPEIGESAPDLGRTPAPTEPAPLTPLPGATDAVPGDDGGALIPDTPPPADMPPAEKAADPADAAASGAGRDTASPSVGNAPPLVVSVAPAPPPGPDPELSLAASAEAETLARAMSEPVDEASEDAVEQAVRPARSAPVRRLALGGASSSRLPQIGVEDDSDAAADPAEAAPRLGPLARNAEPFRNPEAKPPFSVILVHDPAAGIGVDVLSTFSFPVTFAVDPVLPGATEAADAFRAAGYEVVVMATGLPEGATASDVEVTLASHLATVPSAVAVMDPKTGGFAGRSDLTAQALAILGAEGYGAIGWSRGVSGLRPAAADPTLPVALVDRQIDEAAGEAAEIRRVLDRAAFQASQNGSIVVAGRTRPETIRALFEWAGGEKAAQLALAPISAVLRGR